MEVTTKVKKPIEAIQCTNTFSLLQRKMYNVLLANAAGNLFPEVTHRINMRTLCNLMGYRSNDYKTIKQKFRELRRMDIEWDVINEKGNNVWTNTSPLSLARVIEGEGICEYEFTPSLIPYLDRPAQYAKFSLAIQAKFKSGYGLALYENCERYRNIGYSRSFDIPTFRKLMGVDESEYLEFFALKRRVIAIAIKEVNQYADFDVEGEYEKNGRTITAVKFLIKNKQIDFKVLPHQPEVALDDKLSVKLKHYFGLKQPDIDKHIKKYSREYVDEKVNTILDSDSFKKGLIKNMPAYLKTALSEDFQIGVSSKVIVEKNRRDREILLNKERAQEKALDQVKKEHEYYLSKEIGKLIPKLNKKNRQKILMEFEEHLGSNSVFLALFQKNGLDNVLILDRFTEFTKVKYPEILDKLMSFDEYVKQFSSNT